ncbi:MAG: VOC family protein [Defluviitaleaceae bacterium]|nr:VOC family protein [Defluviitaleaceae bacterium]
MYFWHTGILTNDLDKTIGEFCALPGVRREQWSVMEVEFPQEKMTVGKGGKLKGAYARIYGDVYELLQPLDSISYHAAELNSKGAGPHHLAFVCPDDQDAALKSLIDNGGRVVWEFRNGGERACYVKTADGSMIFELINVCPFMPE